MNESCHTRISHATHTNGTERHYVNWKWDEGTCEWDTTYIWIRHNTHMTELTLIWPAQAATTSGARSESYHTCTHTLQHTATHCSTLQHIATHCNTLHHNNCMQGVILHMHETCPKWMSHITCAHTHCSTLQHTATHCNTLQHNNCMQGVILHIYETCPKWMSHITYARVISHTGKSCHTWTSHVTYECVMSYLNESRHSVNASCQIWIELRDVWMSHVTGIIWMSHGTYEWVMAHMN